MEVTHDELIDAALSLANTDIPSEYENSGTGKELDFQSMEPLGFDLPMSFGNEKHNWTSVSRTSNLSSSLLKKETIGDSSLSSLSGSIAAQKLEPAARKKAMRRKSSTYRGVSFNYKAQRFKSVLTVNKKQIFLGYFDNEEDAARAYDEASRVHKGPNARLNFGVDSDKIDSPSNSSVTSSLSSLSSSSSSSSSLKHSGLRVQVPTSMSSSMSSSMSPPGSPMNLDLGGLSPLASPPFSPLSPGASFSPPASPRSSSLGSFMHMTSLSSTPPPPFIHSIGFPTGRESILGLLDEVDDAKDTETETKEESPKASSSKRGLKSRPRLELQIPNESNAFSERQDLGTARKRIKSEEEIKPLDSPTMSFANLSFTGSPRASTLGFSSPPSSPSSPTSVSSRPAPTVPWTKTSKYRGVSFNKNNNKYKGVLTYKGKQIFLGYFEDELSAAKAYDEAVLRYRGPTSGMNFPLFPKETKPVKQSTSKYRGVSWCRTNRRYKSVNTYKGQQIFNGYFDTEEEAARAYDRTAIKQRGIQAALNFPDESLKEYAHNSYDSSDCMTPKTKDLVERSSRLRLSSLDNGPPPPPPPSLDNPMDL